VASQVSCAGSAAAARHITIKGGHLVRQALRRRLTEVDLVLPDATVGGAEHASFAATMFGMVFPARTTPSPVSGKAEPGSEFGEKGYR
jgi:hypothetical protein